jgi:hypothetical protein
MNFFFFCKNYFYVNIIVQSVYIYYAETLIILLTLIFFLHKSNDGIRVAFVESCVICNLNFLFAHKQ